MLRPLEISFHNTAPVDEVETRIRQELAELEKFCERIVSCRVDVELPKHARRGSVSKVLIDLELPAEVAMAKIEPKKGVQHVDAKAQHKNAAMAVHGAFNIARRRLEDLKG
ncbi:MAG: HPF/RaiA family ribosome-associated protein [Acidobacteriia bacterium]|nr:HPF/RaiA family ribosome-associated protein [Terriglobia bacterium]